METGPWAAQVWFPSRTHGWARSSPRPRCPPLREVLSSASHPQLGVYLDLPELARALHPAGHVDRVAPDVILWFLGPYHSGHYRSMVQP